MILNSVAQYFPSIEYLLKVLEGAIESVEEGSIFVGDLRSLPLLKAFHTSVQLHQAPESMPANQILAHVQHQVAQEEELVVDPAFFAALQNRIPRITGVEILLKRGRHRNEMSQFRYDVILRVGTESRPTLDCTWLDWKRHGLTLAELHRILAETAPDMLGISSAPNARVWKEVSAMNRLIQGDATATVGDLKKLMQEDGAEILPDPEDLSAMAAKLGYFVSVSWSGSGANGYLDAVFHRRDTARAIPRFPETEIINRPWKTYANDPVQGAATRNLVPELRGWLKDRLPEYMVPSAIVVLDAFPLTPNGKVNRRALPTPEHLGEENAAYVAPRTPIEGSVATIWAELLHAPKVGAQDDFFALGGHSLLATQVISRLRQLFRVELPLRALFEAPTVAALAGRIENAQRTQRGLQLPPLGRSRRDQRLPLSFAQQRLWFLDQLEPNNPLYNIPCSLRADFAIDVEILERSLNALAERHETLRTTFIAVDGEPEQVIAPSVQTPLSLVDFTHLPKTERNQEAQRRMDEEAKRPFDLAHGPLLRATVLRLGHEEDILLLNIHHIISDRWSMGVLLQELSCLYGAYSEGKHSPLAELSVQYADFAVWQRQLLQGEVFQQQLAYWKDQLKDAPPVLELPTDRPRLPVETFRGDVATVAFSNELSAKLNTLSRGQGVTLFMTLLAAFQTLLARYSGSGRRGRWTSNCKSQSS